MKKNVLIFVTLFLFFLGIGLPVYSCEICVDDWWVSNYDTIEDLQAVAFNYPLYVAVGRKGNLLISVSEGTSWIPWDNIANNLLDIVYSCEKNLWVAVGVQGTIRTSQDGLTWAYQSPPVPDGLYAISFGNGTFIAGGANGRILLSTDGVNWTIKKKGTGRINDFAFNDTGRVAFCNSQGQIFTSDNNGNSWVLKQSLANMATPCITYGNGVWLAGGRNKLDYKPSIWKSTDNAETWAPVTTPCEEGGYVMDMAYTGSDFVAVGIYFILTSSDGDNWVQRFTPPKKTPLYGVAVGEYNVVAVGPKGLTVTSEFCD